MVKCNPIINKEEKSSTNLKEKNKWCYAIIAFSFSLKVGKVLAFLQSLGSEFHILAPLYAKLFCPNFVLIPGGLRFKLELRSILFVTADMLLKRLDEYVGAWPLIAL